MRHNRLPQAADNITMSCNGIACDTHGRLVQTSDLNHTRVPLLDYPAFLQSHFRTSALQPLQHISRTAGEEHSKKARLRSCARRRPGVHDQAERTSMPGASTRQSSRNTWSTRDATLQEMQRKTRSSIKLRAQSKRAVVPPSSTKWLFRVRAWLINGFMGMVRRDGFGHGTLGRPRLLGGGTQVEGGQAPTTGGQPGEAGSSEAPRTHTEIRRKSAHQSTVSTDMVVDSNPMQGEGASCRTRGSGPIFGRRLMAPAPDFSRSRNFGPHPKTGSGPQK